ncbi:MAG: carboxypeptidase-like regulatory domain-containing protein [Deltaproteobacteria bacterium]|nr:carboxypeptidase-like regulatory domain-containing protein [Deltaproteobacteria bacterium]
MRSLLCHSLFAAGALVATACGSNNGNGPTFDAKPADVIDATPPPPDACVGLECKKVDCSTMGGGTTTLSGIVYAPNGTLPLSGVTVYVPNADPGPIPEGVQCNKCNDTLAGQPVSQVNTDEAGHFVLPDVPVTADLPVIIQVGKWRRQITIPTVAACTDTPVDAALTRLPRNHTEGDMPKIALSTGGADALECLPLKLGIDPAEITTGSETGRVNLFVGSGGGTSAFDSTFAGGARTLSNATTFWNTESNLDKYDIVMLSCEGSEYEDQKSPTALQNMYDYANKGGRVFATHYHYYWINAAPQPWPMALTLNDTGDFIDVTATVDETFDKGKALATWLVNVGASTVHGKIDIADGRNIAKAINSALAQQYIYLEASTGYTGPQISQFTTPLDVQEADRCGKVVYSDMHVSTSSFPGDAYPLGCSADLTPQEKALAFVFFDIASCVGPIIN